MMDMLAKVLKKKFEKGGVRIEIHADGKDKDAEKQGTDLAPEVKDANSEMQMPGQNPEDEHMDFLKSMTDGDANSPMDRKPTLNEKAKGRMREKMASMKKK